MFSRGRLSNDNTFPKTDPVPLNIIFTFNSLFSKTEMFILFVNLPVFGSTAYRDNFPTGIFNKWKYPLESVWVYFTNSEVLSNCTYVLGTGVTESLKKTLPDTEPVFPE